MALPLSTMLRKIELWLWRLFFVLAIIFMVTWSLAQVLLWGYNHYSKDIEFWLETQSGYDLTFSSSHNQMSGLNPLLSFSDLKIINKESDQQLAEVKNLLIELNTLKSLFYFRPVFDEFVIDSLEMTVRQEEDLSWSLDGFSEDKAKLSTDDSLALNRWVDIVFYQGNIDLRDAVIHLYHAEEAFDRPLKLDVLVSKRGDYTQMEGEVQGDRNPIDLSFRGEGFQLPGEPSFNFDVFVDVDDLDSLDWAQSFQLTEAYRLDRLATSFQVWLNWNRQGVNFVAESEISDLSLFKQDDQRPLKIETSRFYVSGEFSDSYCSINLPSAQALFNAEAYSTSPHRFLCDYLGNWWWTTPQVDLEKVSGLMTWFPNSFAKLKDTVSTLSPTGSLSYPVLWFNTNGDIRFESQLQNFSAQPWDGAPGLTGLNGRLVVEESQGYFDFSATDTQLLYPGIFSTSHAFSSIEGRVDWWFDQDNLRVFSPALALNSFDIDVSLGFSFEWEFVSDEARFALDLGVSEAKEGKVLEFLPNDLDKDLVAWMDDALTQTKVSDGRLLLTTTIDPAGPVTDTLQISTDVRGDQLVFDDEWPSVDNFAGRFEINNQSLSANVSGQTLGNPIEDLSVRYPNIWHDDALDIDVSLSSRSLLTRYLRYIEQSPLKTTVGKALSDWVLDGEAVVLGEFRFNLSDNELNKFNFEVFPQKASVQLPGLPKVDQVKGEILYNDEQQLVVKSLSGRSLDGPVGLTLTTKSDEYHLKGRGMASVPSLLQWKALPEHLNDYLSGDIEYFFNGRVGEGEAYSINVHSDLKGVISSLPYPMTKEDANQSMIFVYQGTADSQGGSHSVDVGALNVDYEVRPKTGTERTVVSFGQLPKESRIPDQGTFLFARLSKLDFKAWIKALEGIDAGDDSKAPSIYADVMIQQASVGEMLFDNLSISSSSSYLGHRVALRSRQVAGAIRFPREQGVVDVDLDYLVLPKKEVDESSEHADLDLDPLMDLNPMDLPAANIKVSRLQQGTKELGFWRTRLEPIKDGLVLNVEESNLMGIKTTGQVIWTYINDQHTTYVDSQLSVADIRSVFKKLGYEPSFEAETVKLNAVAYWKGSPAAFDHLKTQGFVDIKVENGQFLNVSNTASPLKVFGLFNLSSLGRRLKLDFSDVYSSGLAFDEISGVMTINNEVMDIDEAIEITGPSANISLVGATNMKEETLDMQMRLSVPVSGTLPLAVVVAGVNPLIGGIMLLGQGVWGGVVDQFTGVNYQISGSWEDPVMEATSKVGPTE